MSFRFSKRSLQNLDGVHPDLKKVMSHAIKTTDVDFVVIEGLRSIERQRELFDRGATKTMNSRHLTGHAVDVVPYIEGAVSWHWPDYYKLADNIKRAAKDMDVPLDWGGDWAAFKDGPHWQLPWNKYPALHE